MDQFAVTAEEVFAEMDELGREKWNSACTRVENRKLREALAEARNARNQPAPTGTPDGSPGEVPPAGEPDPVTEP